MQRCWTCSSSTSQENERGSLQLPLLLDYPRKDSELAPSQLQCKARLDETTGGLLGEMMGDPVILGAVVVAGGSVTAALTGCATGASVWPARTPLFPGGADSARPPG